MARKDLKDSSQIWLVLVVILFLWKISYFYHIVRLVQLFGANPEFNEDMALNMKRKMIEELGDGEKREYMSAPGM